MFSARWRCVLLVAPLLSSALGCASTGGSGVASHTPGSGMTAAEREVRVAELYERQGDTKRAAIWYNRALAHQPNHPEALKGLENVVAARNGKPRESKPELVAKRYKARREAMDANLLARKPAKKSDPEKVASEHSVAKSEEVAAAAGGPEAGIADLAVTEDSHQPLVVTDSDDDDESLLMEAEENASVEETEVATTTTTRDKDDDNAAEIPVIVPAENPATLHAPNELVAMLGSDEARSRSIAAFRLGQLNSDGKKHLTVLQDALAKEHDGSVRVHIAEAIVRIDGADPVAAAILIESMRTGDDDVRWLSALALECTATSDNKEVCVALGERLSDNSAMVRAAAAMSLGAFGKSAEGSLDKLNGLLTDTDSDVKEAAAVAIESIEGGSTSNDGVMPVSSVLNNNSAKSTSDADDFDFDLGEEEADLEL